jgi:glycosyltransferase involved in cell wall biosynthesis
MSYPFPESGQWGEEYIMRAWSDFAGEDGGIIMSLWDLSRMFWFAQPHRLREDLATFLGPGRNFMKWAYVPVDATGPDEHGLPIGMAEAARGYERVCAASEWGKRVIERHRPCNWIPHGLDMSVFSIGPRRGTLDWPEGQVVVGCNMANQSRKDWPIAFETARILKADLGNKFKFWAHTDTMIGHWNLYALATDYGIGDCIEVTMDLTDAHLAQRYSACDCTILPTAGEGFGYPIAESMACGTPCVTTDYAAGQELVEDNCKVPPVAYRIDTQHDVRRAVLSGWGFAGRAKAQIERKREDWDETARLMWQRVEHLDWANLGRVWERWFLEGIGL